MQRQIGKPTLTDSDRAILAGLLRHLPKDRLRRLLLLVRPDTVLRWHRELLRRRHAVTCVPRRRGRPRTLRLGATRHYAIITDAVGTPTELLSADGRLAWQHRTTL